MKITLIGDSIRMGYQPLVAQKLAVRQAHRPELSRRAESAEVWGPVNNGGDSRNVLEHLDEWVIQRPADVIHLNCGLHDLKVGDGSHQVSLEDYVDNLKQIVERLACRQAGLHTGGTGARLIWATTTPVIDERHQSVKAFARHNTDVQTYNAAALEVINSAPIFIGVNDLYEVIIENNPEKCILDDGVHMSDFGNEVLSDKVVAALGA